jgi:hypothetical protein
MTTRIDSESKRTNAAGHASRLSLIFNDRLGGVVFNLRQGIKKKVRIFLVGDRRDALSYARLPPNQPCVSITWRGLMSMATEGSMF